MKYRNLQDNIEKDEYNDRAKGILEWIKGNRDKFDWAKDPNAYEMTNLFLLGGKYAKEGEDIDKSTVQEMWEIRSGDFEHAGVSEENFVYQICKDSYEAMQNGKCLVNDEASHHALRKMAGIGLYCSQQKRDTKTIEYNNPKELLELVEASRTLKGIHPDLFEKYHFQENLTCLCQLQPENPLNKKIRKAMKDIGTKEAKGIENKEIQKSDEIEK